MPDTERPRDPFELTFTIGVVVIEPSNPVLSKMLERLFASLVNGPAMNCRPHASRQRVDFANFGRLKDAAPGEAFLSLLGPDRSAAFAARVAAPARAVAARTSATAEPEVVLSPEERAARQEWLDQSALLGKLRVIAEDARTYEQDTGVHALSIGFPILSLPPGSFGGRAGVSTRRVLAPVAFIPIDLTLKSGPRPAIELAGHGEGIDRVVPNAALLAWLEQQTGSRLVNPFDDEKGEAPWREIVELVRAVAARAGVQVPHVFEGTEPPADFALTGTPKADADEAGAVIIPAAVLGLFPSSNQGLLNDTRDLIEHGAPDGPLVSFVRHGVSLEIRPDAAPPDANATPPVPVEAAGARRFSQERLITAADPCQTRAVRLAQQSRGLVIHGPPGTGKSQTIANVIGDHLSRGQRVLFVCDKRTALDVVADRLRALGLGDLCGVVHDPQRDQREFYRSVREQLDNLADTALKAGSVDRVAKIDAELQSLHDELTAYYRDLMGDRGGPGSFHHLVGQWLAETGDAGDAADWDALQKLRVSDFEGHQVRLKECLERGEAVGYARNPWKDAAGLDLDAFLSRPMAAYRSVVDSCRGACDAADATAEPLHPPFRPDDDLPAEAQRRRLISAELTRLSSGPLASAGRWLGEPIAAVRAGGERLVAADVHASHVRSRPLDGSLRKRLSALPSPESVAKDRRVFIAYAEAFDARAADYARVRAAVPEADDATVLKWMAADARAVASARKRLDGASAIADAVEGSTLDASLLPRFEASPVEPGRLTEWLAALGAYLDVAGKWHSAFQFGKKKAAEPAVRHFGLSLSPAAATQVRQFLSDVQKRSDLRAAVESATGTPLVGQVDDAELISTYRQHRAVLAAVTVESSYSKTGFESDARSVSAANTLLGSLAESAAAILRTYGLTSDAANARRIAAFLDDLEARASLAKVLSEIALRPDFSADTPDAELLASYDHHVRLLDLLSRVAPGAPVRDAVARALTDESARAGVISALDHSPHRAAAAIAAEKAFADSGLFAGSFLASVDRSLRAGDRILPELENLASRLDTLEGVIRVKAGLAALPAELSDAASALLAASSDAAAGFSAIRRNVLAGEIVRRLRACPSLQQNDARRLQGSFDRFEQLGRAKKDAVRDLIQNLWVSRQRERLLASTGSRLNATGADLRRRLTTRGERAMRLRQVIAHGAAVEGGDPLFDLRPVWMASPETVAQLFPREPIFDVVVFDEASQCRLEEALPVMTRAKRVVIAGDPKQLPPTRFFESAVSTSQDFDADTEQELFESHQGEVEDLLAAALGIDVHQCYLDVHYRSRNADLIGFSNEHFYGSRLQAIPGHPRHRTRYAPITLYRADGVYEKRRNVIEAEQVCHIVRDLLKRASPPSIGIACFNMTQRDLILEKLDELAAEDAEFAHRLAEARARRGAAAPEGLFVKNLENVQGDERDHLIISTTYGPDATGRFRRNFGPLGTAGGGRRLNVLVTRARDELHLVTSMPRSAYASLPEVPQGMTPGGAWLLFAYLRYAEQLQETYEINHRIIESSGPAAAPSVNARATRNPSTFAKALAKRLAATLNRGSDVHWGNEGFCVDVAMQHPTRVEDVTLGILCDMTRFGSSDDPVEWDVFSTGVHASQGWTLHRVWTPHFFRDPEGSLKVIAEEVHRGDAEGKSE